ncbi:Acetylornithine deacetylase/Succinyl-diaminopimelate desuccinylase [Gracilibacillus ureilyticus]|uniref:Acetylornithine deacetylase/Succinyl-diaminopimelate desuccinylase n=1 Tax=Gracilibacillus ureilyticus TaxID=531814 RepID=A0A1H9SGY5_9BACI|nr:Acetylornithine deacetylase/Succinyl-diaminopimelate desuccinylase [Gracilibacillus ureilyticus]
MLNYKMVRKGKDRERIMEQVFQYLSENNQEHLEQLKQFLRIPSVSTDSTYKEDVKKAAGFVAEYLKNAGFRHVEVEETNGHPLVFAEWLEAGAEAPTVLFYGHYDVQPAEPLGEWKSEPFDPDIRDGRIYARGASDDKGQVFMHLAVFKAFLQTTGKLPVNVKVCIEGEEEIGSANLYDLLQKEKEKYEADFAVISDSGMVANDQPTILYGLKGFTGLEFTVKGPDNDLHSGMYGGAIRNPAMAMAHILTSMKNEDEVVLVEGFYDGVEELTEDERDLMQKAPGEDFTVSTGAKETVSEKGYTAKEHTMARPTLEINGLYSGYQGEGTKTIIPATATAKLTCRLVPGQDPAKVQDLLAEHIERKLPKGVTVSIKREPLSAKAYRVDPNHPLIRKAAESFSETFGKEAVYVRMGGSIPVVEWLDSIYHIPVVLLGFGTPEDRLHSPNESFPLDHFEKGMQTIANYWNKVKKID